MHRITNHEYSQETLQRSLKGVTFFKELAVSDPAQFDVLLSVAKIEQADANEVIIHQGEATQSLYFLLRGELSVFTTDETHALNTINAGEVFGVMSMLSGKPRSASIKALSKPVLVAAIDFKYFSDIDNFILFNMASKIAFYRMVVNSIRWTLEVNKMADGQHPLVAQWNESLRNCSTCINT